MVGGSRRGAGGRTAGRALGILVMLTRREFLLASAAAGVAAVTLGAAPAAATPALAASAAPDRLDRLGVGLFTLPKALDRDFDGALALLARLGYREVELFGPYPFSTPAAQAGWKAAGASLGFTGSGFFGRTAREVRASLDRHGLTSPSMHVDLDTLRDHLGPIGEAAHTVGWRYAGIAQIPP